MNTSLPFQKDLVVADVHTDPASGQVLEVGTGTINMAVIVVSVPGGGPTAFVGPVMSFYEDQTGNFERLTDEEWQTAYNVAPSLRPSWVNNYLANASGVPLVAGESLITGIDENSSAPQLGGTFTLYQNYPNPFNPSTIIAFKVPQALSNTYVRISVYNTLGEKVRTLLSGDLAAGNYTVRWDRKNADGAPAASGVYFCRLTATGVQLVKKMVLIR